MVCYYSALMLSKTTSGSVRKPAQLPLRFHRRGGARAGAGRPKSAHSGVPHRARPSLSRHHPLHITLRVEKAAPSLRGAKTFRAIKAALAQGRERFGFRLVHYSVQGNHIHLIAEANDRTALTRGVQALTIRLALSVNRTNTRRGRLFSDRYHARALKTPLEVRRALLYVLRNDRRHLTQKGVRLFAFDPCSSAREFNGWKDSALLRQARRGERAARGRGEEERTTTEPRAFLLRVGWQRHGLLGLEEVPARGRIRAQLSGEPTTAAH
jgi:REP element-mobilizing transposase RayT